MTGQGNIIRNAEKVVGEYNNSVIEEQKLLNEIEKYLINNGYGEDDKTEGSKVDENGLATENVIIKPEENNNTQIVIPTGFAPVILETGTTQSLPGENGSVKEIMPYEEWNNITIDDINKGIVVVDHAITYDNGQVSGTVPDFNEYVWIPIPESSKLARTAWTTTCGYDLTGNWVVAEVTHSLSETAEINKFWEDKTKSEYTQMVDSIINNKGFYIGRYEASKDSTGTIAQSKRNQETWTTLTQTDAITACTKNKITNAHLIYGIEWDSILNWLIGNAIISSTEVGKTKTMEISDVQTNSYSWGNCYDSIGNALVDSGEVRFTGTSEYWKSNNIYDLAGNVGEMTQENYSTENNITIRGDSCYNDDSYSIVALRWRVDTEYTGYYDRFPY